jgi:ABC-type multidrug transport system ATPase subunit
MKPEELMALLEVRNIHKDFISGARIVKAVNDVSFKVEKGEMIAVTGPPGAGKYRNPLVAE